MNAQTSMNWQLPSLRIVRIGIVNVKPFSAGAGNGIFVTRASTILNDTLNSYMDTKKVVQPYLENPFLVDGYKFEVRLI